MNEELISEFVKECIKNFNEIKKKTKPEINNALDTCLANLISLGKKIPDENNKSFEEIYLTITDSFLEATKLIINLKYSKFFYNILIAFKKFLEYKLFSKEKTNEIIRVLKKFNDNQKISEDCNKKILEIIQTYIFSDYFEFKYTSLSNIYMIILREFNITNNSLKKDFINPIRLLFTTLTDKIYKSNNFDIIIQITKLIFFWYSSTLFGDNNDNKNQELLKDINEDIKDEIIEMIGKNRNKIFIRCLSLDLLSQGFLNFDSQNIINKNKDDSIYDELNALVKDKIMKAIEINMNKIKNNYSFNEEEYIFLNYLKIYKFLNIFK